MCKHTKMKIIHVKKQDFTLWFEALLISLYIFTWAPKDHKIVTYIVAYFATCTKFHSVFMTQKTHWLWQELNVNDREMFQPYAGCCN